MPQLKQIASLSGHEERVWHVCWSPDGKRFASCGEDKTVRIWMMAETSLSVEPSFYCAHVIDDGHTRTVRCCEWSPCSRFLASASFDGTVLVYQSQGPRSWLQIASLEGHDNEVKSVAWSADGLFLATCGRDKKIWVWEKVDGNDFECSAVLDGHTQDVKFLTFHSHSPYLFSSSYDDTVKIWTEDNGDWYCVQTLVGHQSTVWGVLPLSAGRLVTVSDDKSAILWVCDSDSDFSKDWRRVSVYHNLHSQAVYSVHAHESQLLPLVCTGGGDNSIILLSISRADDGMETLVKEGEVEQAHDGDVNCVRWNPRGEVMGGLLVSAGDDGMIKLWRLEI